MLHTVSDALTLMRERGGRRLRPDLDCVCKHCMAVETLFLTTTLLDNPEDPSNAKMTQDLVRFIDEWSREGSV